MGRSSPYVSLEEERKQRAEPARAVPFILLTGFLGAGKTTLLNRLLSAPQGKRIAVLVNDVGQINVDRQLLAAQAGDLIELSGGCVCCKIDLQRDLWSGVDDLVERAAPDVVVLETTGIADPRVLLAAFDEVEARRRSVAPSGVVCVVDAEVGLDGEKRPEWSAQIECADRIVLTKLDRADVSTLPALHARLSALAPGAERVAFPASEEGTQALARFLLEPRAVNKGDKVRGRAHRHTQLEVTSYVDDAPLLEAPLRALIDELGDALVRLKGHACVVGEGGERWCYVERAGRATSIQPRKGKKGRAELVFIMEVGAENALSDEVLRRRLWACRAG